MAGTTNPHCTLAMESLGVLDWKRLDSACTNQRREISIDAIPHQPHGRVWKGIDSEPLCGKSVKKRLVFPL